MSVINKLQRKLFDMVVVRSLPAARYLGGDGVMSEAEVRRERFRPVLVLMSRESEREIMREDYGNMTGILTPGDRTQPRKVFGVRVAFDDSLAVGEFLVAETLV